MHTDWTVETVFDFAHTQELEVDNFHTEEEAKEAAIRDHADRIVQMIEDNPDHYVRVEEVWEPEQGHIGSG